MTSEVGKVTVYHRQQGLIKFEEGNYGRAFAHLSFAISLHPSWKDELESAYITALDCWCEELELKKKFNELYLCYEQALVLFPKSSVVHFSLASHLYRIGHVRVAAKYFNNCLSLNKNHLLSYHYVQSIHNQLVERWHFRMLNDRVRNSAYKRAIAKKISQSHNEVLDIGTGTGLLSLYAIESGAKKVYACEHSPIMIEIATEVLKRNNYSKRIKLIEKTSTELTIPGDLSRKVSLIVTETMDAGVFGENLFQSIMHAWNHLLLPSNAERTESGLNFKGICIPHSIRIFAVLIQSDFISKKYNSATYNYKCLPIKLPKFVAAVSEPYDSQNLKNMSKHIQVLSKPEVLMTVNLNQPEKLQKLFHDNTLNEKTIITTASGRVDAIVCYFDLYLDEEIVISSSPFEEKNIAECWEQAIFPIFKPFYVTEEEKLDLYFSCSGGKLNVRLSECRRNTSEERNETVTLTKNNVRILNDEKLMKVYKNVVSEIYLDCNPLSGTDISILELSLIPILSLMLVAELQKNESTNYDLMYHTEDETVENFVKSVVRENVLNSSKIKSFSDENLISFFLDCNKKYDFIIVNNLILSNGSLNDNIFFLLPLIRKSLKPGGRLLPENVTCFGQLTHSSWLTNVSSVSPELDNNLFGIPDVINKFQVPVHRDLILDFLEYTSMSDQFQLFTIDSSLIQGAEKKNEFKVSTLRDGYVNNVLIWFEVKFLHDKPTTSIFTKNFTSWVHQSAVIIDPPIQAAETAPLSITAIFQKGLFKINVDS